MAEPKMVAIVTGGGSGIGAAVARQLAKKGAGVAVVGRRASKLAETVEEIERLGGTGLAVEADLADPAAPARIVAVVTDRFGRLDIIVNCAAAIRHGPFEKVTQATFDEHTAVNVRAPYFLIQAALPWVEKSDNASIVNISSSSGSLSIPTQSVYGLTKAALEYLTRSLAAELAPRRIRVNCVAPGPVDTPIHLTWAGDDIEGAYRRMAAEVPLGRIGSADELGAWIAHFTEADATFVTGAVIPVDGGQTLAGALSKI